tara:strand:+ start:553 stop:843 length:291 start_codon:yes stop_codon:yes gene_type:complete
MAKRQFPHPSKKLTIVDVSRVVEMAWEDRTPFEAIKEQFNLREAHVIDLMRRELQKGAFRVWRKRVSNRKAKHRMLRSAAIKRGYCPTQYKIRSKT